MIRYFGVWCEVSGGVTGHRAAWLKDEKGEPKRFADPDTAKAEAARLTDARRSKQTAVFSYTAMAFPMSR